MEKEETSHLIVAIFVLAIVISFRDLINLNGPKIAIAIVFSFIIICINWAGKKIIAYNLDADVRHKIWQFERFGFKEHEHYKKPVPFGIIIPLALSILSLGAVKFMTLLTYETSALKRRAARRHGPFSFTEMTDWHNGIIGAAGIISILLLSIISYFIPGLEPLSRLSAFYAFFNMIPFSKLDGSQIFIGSKVMWYTLAIISIIFASFALFIP